MSLTLITPESEEFDSAIGQSGRVDPLNSPLLDLLRQAVENGLDTFQLPADATVPDGKGGEVPVSVVKIRRWAYDKLPTIPDSPLPDGKRLSISGGKDGRNVQVRIVDKRTSNGKGK